MPSVPCILRSPPFPGARPVARAISVPAIAPLDEILAACSAKQIAPAALDRAAALGRAMTAQRVGGSFWEPPVEHGLTAPTILRPANLAQAQSMLRDLPSARCLALLPTAWWASRAARLFAEKRVAVHRGAADPWSLLMGAEGVYAAGDDELAFFALLAGIPVHAVSAGPFSGWGLTRDASGIPVKGQLDLPRLAHAVLLEGATYRNCFTGA